MSMRVRSAATALAVAGLLSMSCGGVVDPSKNVTETFSGTLAVQGGATFPFDVNHGGEFSVKLTQLSPTVTAIVLLRWGVAVGSDCQPIQQNNAVLNQTALAGAVLQTGRYCVAIFDIGFLSVPQTYTISVSHP
jgi:hypothetical protein